MTARLIGGMLSAHFSVGEFACPCCGFIDTANAMKLCLKLEEVRSAYGPMVIGSGSRCLKHNRVRGGVRDSAHLYSLAADVLVGRDSDRFRLVSILLNQGWSRIGVGPTFVHADMLLTPGYVMWTYDRVGRRS